MSRPPRRLVSAIPSALIALAYKVIAPNVCFWGKADIAEPDLTTSEPLEWLVTSLGMNNHASRRRWYFRFAETIPFSKL